MAGIVLAVAEGALAVLPRLAPVHRRQPDEERARGEIAPQAGEELLRAIGAALERVLLRRVMEKPRRFAELGDAAHEHVTLGGMEVAARRVGAQRPARRARLLPCGERERIL